MINIFLGFYIEEDVAFTFTVTHYDMVRVGERRVFSAFKVIELLPRSYKDEILDRSLNIFHSYVFVALWCVWAHFEPEKIVCL